ncbi:hypothetical protein M422DRAFT_246107 [Sphaerobolus stellatus SS14]|nr:hypothetical protein M422DRAFT_246107 [Sphaerobolus stellatus SS14]
MATKAAAENVISFSKLRSPVAVFVGGTSGIGQGMAEALNLGCKREAADDIFAKMKSVAEPSSAGSYEFIQCDLSLLEEVRKISPSIIAKHPKINYLVITAGYILPTTSPTAEGLDKKMVLHYYARWKFAHALTPALLAAKEAKEDAKVLSVYAAGSGGKSHEAAINNDLMCEEFAIRNPGIVFGHATPGVIHTNLLKNSDSLLVRTLNIALPLLSPLTVSQDECTECLWNRLHWSSTGENRGSTGIPGAYQLNRYGGDLGASGYYGTSGARKIVWQRTLEITKTEGP